ncbi:MAG TPA: trypsin-like peptidase domain-containing protein [Chthoniobacteraceae bacterium]|nr:trypsin-like peptidase domain-containing protein [Chthoniobacteraceae bacterium]
MIRHFWLIVLASTLGATFASGQPSEIRKSVARINNTAQDPNYRIPWLPGANGGGNGTGWVVSGDRLMTNAHVVSNAKFLTVEKEGDPRKYIARVEHVAHDCDLAVLKVDDPAFFKGTKPLPLGGIPELESTVTVLGYPIGGDRLSVTQGVVSRVDFRTYTHSVVDSHLSIQIDAAINPGNSGGPVMQNGYVVGVAFQGYSGDVAQNVGYMIPTPVIRHFLDDVKDGKYDRYVDISVGTFPIFNPAQRKALGLADDDRGIMVSSVMSAGVAHGILDVGDVILSVDGKTVSSDGMVEIEGERVLMAEVVERKFVGDSVKLEIIRNKEPKTVTIKFTKAFPFTMQANQYETLPEYVLFGGLLFQPLTRNLMNSFQFQNPRVDYYFDFFLTREIYKKHPEVIVMSTILNDPLNTYLQDFREGIVESVNGQEIKTLKDLSDALASKVDVYVIEFVGLGRPLVLERAAVEAARDRIRTRYNVTDDQYLGETAKTL